MGTSWNGKARRCACSVLFQTRADIVYMLDIYAKNEKSDLTPADKRELRAIVSMLEEPK